MAKVGDRVGLARLQTVKKEVVEMTPVVYYEGVVKFETNWSIVFEDGLEFAKGADLVILPVKPVEKK